MIGCIRSFTLPPQERAIILKENKKAAPSPPAKEEIMVDERTVTNNRSLLGSLLYGKPGNKELTNMDSRRKSMLDERIIESLIHSTKEEPSMLPNRMKLTETTEETKFSSRKIRKATAKLQRGILRFVNLRTEIAWRRARQGPPEPGVTYTVRMPQKYK